MWSNTLSDTVNKLNVRNEWMIVLEVDFGERYCLINIYMPTNKKDSELPIVNVWMCCMTL